MPKLSRLAGSTGHMLTVFVQNSTLATGAGLTGLTYNSTGLTCYYKRNTGTASVAVTLANITTLGTYTSGGLREIDSANMPGVFEFHPPDAAYAAGAKSVVFMLQGATNMAPVLIEVELTATDNQDAQRYGMNALPATGTLAVNPTLNASQTFNNTGQTSNLPTDLQTIKGQAVTAAAGVTFPSVISSYAGGAVASVTAPVTVGTNQDKTGYSLAVAPPTAAQVATAVLTDTTAGDLAVAGSLGYLAGNAPAWYAAPSVPPTAAAIATAVLTDAASADLAQAGSLGHLVTTAPAWYVAPDNADVAAIKATIGVAGAGLTALGDTRLANLDAAVSTRLATTAYTAPDNADAAATLALLAGLVVSGDHTQLTAHALANAPTTAGVSAAAIAAAILTDTTAGDLGVAGSLGYLVGHAPAWYVAPDNADIAAIRATIGTAGAGLTALGDGRLANLDAAVSTRSTYAGGAVASVTAPVTVGTVQDKAGYALAPTGLDPVAVEAGLNARQALALAAAGDAGQVTYASGGTTVTITGAGVSTPRITATVDASGNRVPTIHPPA